eukprot:TRINITY_DN3998_c0_g1_i1.p1 TRINITY_DN3998_c0_g1~~TRINITY_DN3998_c0_g1_i1.p1  ORF type:complete len:105 (-),score=11.96 TRINITY_DN3998_c0_g1_i1:39-353(-)
MIRSTMLHPQQKMLLKQLHHLKNGSRCSLNIRRYSNFPIEFNNGVRIFTRAEVASHKRVTDGWVIIDDKVYNVTTWIPFHPGGEKLLTDVCDCTKKPPKIFVLY